MNANRTVLSLAALLLAAALPSGPGRAADPPPRRVWTWPARATNLNVLPKKTSADQLRAAMTGYTRALGVRCSHCHVGEEGQPLSTYDFASDRKPHKEVARGMMKMVREINEELDEIRGEMRRPRAGGRGHEHGAAGEPVRVECFTCHRGVAIPTTLSHRLSRIYGSSGADSALGEYRPLRRTSLEAGSYDFRESSLEEVANRALERGDAAGAVLLFEENLRQFPESGRSYENLARAWLARGDTARAVTEYERALRVDPRSQRAREALERLRRP